MIYQLLRIFWDHFQLKNVFFDVFCLVAVFVSLAGDGEGGGEQFWDHFGIILGPFQQYFIYIFSIISIRVLQYCLKKLYINLLFICKHRRRRQRRQRRRRRQRRQRRRIFSKKYIDDLPLEIDTYIHSRTSKEISEPVRIFL